MDNSVEIIFSRIAHVMTLVENPCTTLELSLDRVTHSPIGINGISER